MIASADAFAHGLRSERNDRITSGMTTQIVDHFEIVDINEQHRIARLMPRQGLPDGVYGSAAIEQSRQAVAD